jgi:hypothetical protein
MGMLNANNQEKLKIFGDSEIFENSSESSLLACDSNGDFYALSNGKLGKFRFQLLNFRKFDALVTIRQEGSCKHISVYNDRLYVCADNTIYTYNLNLTPISGQSFGSKVYASAVIDNVICVTLFDEKQNSDGLENAAFTTHFYRLPTFELISIYEVGGSVFTHNRLFYVNELKGPDNKLSVFSAEGTFVVLKTVFLPDTSERSTNKIGLIKGRPVVCLKDQSICFF